MPETKLDVVINPRGAQEGAAAVKAALKGMGNDAQSALQKIEDRFNGLRNALFSIQGLLGGLAFAAVAREAINLSIGLERAERSLRAITTSGQAAFVQLERIRQIGDTFQLFDDQQMVNAFRLLASHGVQDAEGALKTIANAAASTGLDIETMVRGVLSGQERMLRQVGISLVDLGQGEVDIIFGNIEKRVKKTDQAMREGLLQLMQRAFPDATRDLGNSMEFQFKRVQDKWEDLLTAIMRGGLKDAITAGLKALADEFPDEDLNAMGKKISDALVGGLEKSAKAAAHLIDVLTPVGSLIFGVIQHAFAAFEKLPAPVQAVGILGLLLLGPSGAAVLITALALADKLGVKIDEIIAKAGAMGAQLSLATPLGVAINMAIKQWAGKPIRPPQTPEDYTYIGGGAPFSPSEAMGAMTEIMQGNVGPQSTTAATDATNRFFENFHKNLDVTREKAAAAAKEVQKVTGEGLLKGNTGISENDRKVDAQIEELKRQARQQRQIEADKRDLGFSDEVAQNEAKRLEFENSLKQKGLELNEAQKDAIAEVFDSLLAATLQTKAWNTELEVSQAQFTRTNDFLMKSADALRDLQDETASFALPLGASRREEEIRLGMIRTINKDNVKLSSEQFDWLMRQAKAIAEQEASLNAIKFMEDRRLQAAEDLARLQDRIRDAAEGRSVPGLRSRLNADIRDAARRGSPLSQSQIDERASQIELQMTGEKSDALAQFNLQLDREYDRLVDVNELAGKSRSERETELRYFDERNRLLDAGHALSEGDLFQMQQRLKLLQQQRDLARDGAAVNAFVDSFEVGFDTIVRSGQTAYRTLEDGIVAFTQTGKFQMSTFVSFVSQEIMRLIIRSSIGNLLKGTDAMNGFAGLVGSFFGGGGASGLAGAQAAAGRGVANPGLYGPGFASGGSFMVGGAGGTDSQWVGFRATPGERVTVSTPNQQQGPPVIINVKNEVSDSARVEVKRGTGGGGEQEIDVMIISAVQKGMASGRFDKTLGSRFGLTPGRG